jgi:hypothetical protein
MQQRTKRLLKIWTGVVAKITAIGMTGFGAAFILKSLPPNIAAAVVIGAMVIFAGWFTWQIAKLKLEAAELKEARLFRELSKDMGDPPSHGSYAAAMKARLNV